MADWVLLSDYARSRSVSEDAVWALIRKGDLAFREHEGQRYVQEKQDLAARPGEPLVPTGYAEKAMASLLRLHDELMAEKDSRLDLMKRLMDREQAYAELSGYVKLLEEKLSQAKRAAEAPPAPALVAVHPPAPPPPPPAPPPAAAAAAPAPAPAAARPQRSQPEPGRQNPAPRADGWRNW